MRNDRVLQMLGLAARGRKTQSGEFAAERAVKNGSAELVIVAGDASENTKKSFRNMCTYYEVPYYEYGTKETLGYCIGKECRASLAVTDAGLAKAVRERITDSGTIE